MRSASMSASRRFSAGRSMVAPEMPPSSYISGRHTQPSCFWLRMYASQAFALGVEGVEVLLEPLLGGLAGVDGAADLRLAVDLSCCSSPYASPVSATASSVLVLALSFSPKKRGPDQ